MVRYDIIAKPLTNLLTKKGFQWTEQVQITFNLLKRAMVSVPMLALLDLNNRLLSRPMPATPTLASCSLKKGTHGVLQQSSRHSQPEAIGV